jgi:hypothetical protein
MLLLIHQNKKIIMITPSADEDVEKLGHSWWECKIVWQFLLKLKMDLPSNIILGH